MTVATIVDLTPAPTAVADDEDATAEPPSPQLDPTQIEDIVKQAVGFDQVRGDEITVVSAPLTPAFSDEPAAVINMWNDYEPMLRTFGMGVIAFAAFAMGFLVLRKLKPVTVTETSHEPQLSLDEVRHLAELSEQAKNNPEVAAKILESWLGKEDEPLDGEDVGANNAA